MSDPFDDAAASYLQGSAAEIRNSVAQALPVNPDAEAATRRYAAAAQVPLETARALPDQVKVQAQLSQFDANLLQRQFPSTAQLLKNPDLARIAHDDIPGTTAVETAVQAPAAPTVPGMHPAPGKPFSLGTVANYLASTDGDHGLLADAGSAVGSLFKGLGGSFQELINAAGLVTSAPAVLYDKAAGGTAAQDWWFRHMVDPGLEKRQAFDLGADASPADKSMHAAGKLLGMVSQVVLTGGEAAAPAAAGEGLASAVGGAAAHGVKAMAAPALTDAVNTGREVYQATGDGNKALVAAATAYSTTSAMGIVPLSLEGGLLARLASGAASGAVTGEAQRHLMNAAMPDSMQTPFSWENAFVSAAIGATLGGVMGPRARVTGADAALRDTYTETFRAAEGEAQAQQLADIAKAATASKLRERDPEAFKQFVRDAADGGNLQSVQIEGVKLAEMLQKAGVTPDELKQTMPDVARQMDAALGENAPTNSLVSVPIEDFATHIAGSKFEDSFLQEARTAADSATLGETEAFKKTQQEDLQARADQVAAAHVEDQAYTDSVAKMNAQVDANLAGLKMRPDQLAANSALLREFYKTQADRTGVLPHEFAAQYPVTGTNKALAGDVLEQKARGTYSPSTHTIALLKDANLSTFQHELGHFFLDTLSHAAALPDAPAGMQADMAALLKWAGVPDLDSWHEMSIDQQRDLHEKFATGWETYLMKGQAPSLELRGLFQRFRAWMISVYKSLKGAPGDFTPEVRGVFDRMIASEDAIHQAELARKYMPLFDSPEKSGMSAEEWAAYQAQGKDATEQAIEALIGKTMKDMAKTDRLRTASLKAVQRDAAEKRKAIQLEARAEVLSAPVYRAWAFLTGKDSAQLPDEINAEHQQALRDWKEKREEHEAEQKGAIKAAAWEAAPASKGTYKNPALAKGQWLSKNRARIDLDVKRAMLDYDAEHPKPEAPPKPDTASKDPTTGAGKLDVEALREIVGKDGAKPLEALRMTRAKGGMAPGEVADMFGFPDVETMVKALTNAEPPRGAVEGLTDQRMLERHGELSNPDAIARTADELVQNEVRSTFVATELRALKKATGKPREMVAAAKEVAQNTIDTKRIRDISEHQFLAAETRSATQAEKAMMKGDTEGAAVAKRDQLLNMELARAARDGKDFVVKSLEYLAKFDKDSVRERIDLDYRDQIDALLARADLRKSVSNTALDKRASLEAFVEKMAAAGYKPDIAEALLNEAATWHYKDMPLAAFRGLVDSIKSIEHLGVLKERLRDGQETRAIGQLATEMRDTAAQLPQRLGESNRGLTRIEAKWLKAKAFGRSAQASLLKMEQMFDWLDARNPNGVMNRVVFRRMAEAQGRENDLLAATKARIDELVEKNLDAIAKTKKIFTAPGLIDGATGLPQKFTTKEMLMLAGNFGNDSNLGKLAKGENWDPQLVQDFLYANMTPAHWDFVEGMGAALESLWPEKLAMDRRLGNTSPEKIAPRPFTTPDGKTRSGWYWPMMYDPARSQDVAERGARQGDALFENIYSKANTDTGRMNTRNENYARPLLLDLDALPRMIKDEIHDVAWREAVIDADRFTSHPVVRKAVIESLSQEHYDQIRPWLQSIANDGKLDNEGNRGWKWLNKIASEARTRATIVGLGLRLTTAGVHGLSAGMESIAELGPKWFGKGLWDFSNPTQWAANKDAIFEKSAEMRNRMNEVDRDIREHLRTIDTALMDPTSSAMARGADLMRAHAYTMIGGLDMLTALPTWQGAYLKALHPVDKGGLGYGEQDAVYFADKTVRNAHGGTGVKDMAAIQRGAEFQKLFTMFYTFWNHNVNRLIDTGKLITSPEHRAAMKTANHWSDSQIAATVIMRTLVYTLGVQTMHAIFHPPKDGEADSWALWAAKEFGGAAFGGIPIARDLYSHYVTGRDYAVTPAAGLVDMIGKTGQDAANALTGKTVSDKWVKHTVSTAGAVFNLPLGQPSNVAQFLWDIHEGRADPTSASDWYNGVMHGDVKHH
jgi:hypothetical protein